MNICPRCNSREKISTGYCKECWRLIQREYYKVKKDRPKESVIEKKCSSCKELKPISEYTRSCTSRDGFLGVCKDCDHKRRGGKTRLKVPSITLTTAQAAYLAGLIDGEGHITIIKSKRSGGQHKGNHYVWARMSIGITHPIITEIQADYAFGNICRIKTRNPKHKDLISWYISANEMRAVLPQLLPYLRVRKQQAELMLKYLALATRRDRTQQYRDDVDAVHEKIRDLNKRGVD